MKTLSRFVAKFTSLIVAVLSCFDRVIFKGHLPISNGPALEGFVDCVLKIRRCDFMAFAERRPYDAAMQECSRLSSRIRYRCHAEKASRPAHALPRAVLYIGS